MQAGLRRSGAAWADDRRREFGPAPFAESPDPFTEVRLARELADKLLRLLHGETRSCVEKRSA
ncbi:hypothetical protein J2W15_001935 [Pseudarthrobacter sulfonivorans]|nr:hypothetical protein [Pseudarthrobacter sulfonivorans]